MAQRKTRSNKKKAAPSRKRASASRPTRRGLRSHDQQSEDLESAEPKPAQPGVPQRSKLDAQHFPVVALGASIGGLAALE